MKKTNKGFSLVELIIVIAIMAILAGAIAPALIRYIDKSRRSNDVSSAKTIKTAIETALGTEDAYTILTNTDATAKYTLLQFNPGVKYSAADYASSSSTVGVEIKTIGSFDLIKQNLVAFSDVEATAKKQALDIIAQNVGEKVPNLKFKKSANTGTMTDKPTLYYATINNNGTVAVYIGNASTTFTADADGKISATQGFEIVPNTCKEYQ